MRYNYIMAEADSIVEVKNEQETQIAEPGIVYNREGRIIATGWPEVARNNWPQAYRTLGKNIARQVKFELFVRKCGTQNPDGYEVVKGAMFFLRRNDLAKPLSDEVLARKPISGESIKVCDIGGGSGEMLGQALERIATETPALKIEATLTTLVRHDKSIQKNFPRINFIRTMAVEFPPDEFYQAFDVITCQNSVFNWTENPELAVLNMWKMLREGGVVIGTAHKKPRMIDEKEFDTLSYLKSLPNFYFEEIGDVNKENGVAFKLVRK